MPAPVSAHGRAPWPRRPHGRRLAVEFVCRRMAVESRTCRQSGTRTSQRRARDRWQFRPRNRIESRLPVARSSSDCSAPCARAACLRPLAFAAASPCSSRSAARWLSSPRRVTRRSARRPRSRRHANPLELVALGHTRDASTLTITGIVRNPAKGPKLEGLTAVVSLLDETAA